MLSEKTIIKSITIKPYTDLSVTPALATIEVQWADQILKEGAVFSEQYRRKVYNKRQGVELLAEVPNSAAYTAAAGW
ncbi:MAG: hypothetical protein ACYDBH_22520 [Acidobacteriaceae bacterium]